MSKKKSWRDVPLYHLDTGRALNEQERVRALKEYRETGGMYLIVMAEPSGRNDPDEYERLSSAGPGAKQIDWAGFPGSRAGKATGVRKKSSDTRGTPTDEQLAAIRDYAAWAGRKWKDELRADWYRSGSRWPGEYALLQQVRNTYGPEWLAKFKLEESAARSRPPTKSSKKKVERVCLMSGYAYELNPEGGDWTKAKDDFWEIVVIDGGPAEVLGKRTIDGSLVIVARQGGSIYAQTAISVKKC